MIRNLKPENSYCFCTYFDRNYLTRGLALYNSLREHCRHPFVLWVLCFDDETYDILNRLGLPDMRLISRQEFEAGDEELLRARADRTLVEYYWTCTPSLLLYVLRCNPDVNIITYLDADLYFFSDPQPVFDEFGEGSILIVGHRFPAELKHLEKFGIYNVSVLVFRRDEYGLTALQWWREQCVKWCYARLEEGRFGDQKYLDDWPRRFRNVVVLQHKGAGLAPWNLFGYRITRYDGQVWVDDVPLIFYHFHRFQMISEKIFEHGAEPYLQWVHHIRGLSGPLVWIYLPYAHSLQKAVRMIQTVKPAFRTVPKKLSFLHLLLGMSRGHYIWIGSSEIVSRLVSLGLWRAEGERMAKEGFALFNDGKFTEARRTLFRALWRSPEIAFSIRFWKAILPARLLYRIV